MMVSSHSKLDTEALRDYQRELKQQGRNDTRYQPPPELPAAYDFGKVPVRRNWKIRIASLPVVGIWIVRLYRGLYALLHLSALRQSVSEDKERIAALERQVESLLSIPRGQVRPPYASTEDFAGDAAHADASASEGNAGDEFNADAGRFYDAFSQRFRGSDADIENRLLPYVAMVKESLAEPTSPNVVDIGCGSGVWMRLLAKNGIASVGFDLNAIATQKAREQGLDARFADGMAWLAEQAPQSLDVITAFHVIEHLPQARLLAFFAVAHRVLKAGGLLICETPNPENMLVATCNFYLDFSHRNPIPPALAAFMAEYAGFAEVRTQGMNPFPEAHRVPELGAHPLATRFNQFFYGAQDYALLARK
jgi:O-antigen chain-terminating methyltransferase